MPLKGPLAAKGSVGGRGGGGVGWCCLERFGALTPLWGRRGTDDSRGVLQMRK